jgi:hypothetical protein
LSGLKSLIFEALGLEKLKPKVARSAQLGSGLMFAGSFHHFVYLFVVTQFLSSVLVS